MSNSAWSGVHQTPPTSQPSHGRAPASSEARLQTVVSAGRAHHAWPDITASSRCWASRQVPYQVAPMRVHMQVLGRHHSPPLVTWLVLLFCTIQAEVAATDRCVGTPVHPSHCSYRSPTTIMSAVLVPSATHALVTVSLVPQLLHLLHCTPVVGLCITRHGDSQLTKHRTDHASRSLQRYQHNWRPDAPLSAAIISVNSLDGTLFCSSSLTRTKPLTDLL